MFKFRILEYFNYKILNYRLPTTTAWTATIMR